MYVHMSEFNFTCTYEVCGDQLYYLHVVLSYFFFILPIPTWSSTISYTVGQGPTVTEFLDFSAIPILNADIQEGGKKFIVNRRNKGSKLS